MEQVMETSSLLIDSEERKLVGIQKVRGCSALLTSGEQMKMARKKCES